MVSLPSSVGIPPTPSATAVEEDTTLPVDEDQLHDLLYQALETELGGVQVYEAALACARNDDLRQEWEHYLEQTRHHVELVEEALRAFGLDPAADPPGRRVVRHTGEALVKAIALAQGDATPDQAQVVAAECVTLAETKDHLNWELLGEIVKRLSGEPAKVLRAAHKEVEEQEDEHLYHNSGWARELWIEGLGLPAVLPPPEEQKDVKTAIGAARAKQTRHDLT
jgi:rubrerythrin